MSATTRVELDASAQLRRARPEDRDALVAMYQTFEPKGDTLGLPPRKDPEPWLENLASYPNFIVALEGRVIGHAALCADRDSGEVVVFVHQNYRGHGLGKKLLSALIEEARRLGLRQIWAITEYDYIPIFRLANKFGFVQGDDPQRFYLNL
jgi:L-amino acid N-acyltransferase YncA